MKTMSTAKVPLSPEELKTHLADQLAFLEASAEAFDRGFEIRGKRLAVTLRILLHDHRNSKSLLGQLGMKDQDFVSTALPLDPASITTHGGLVWIAMGLPKTRYVPMLDDGPVQDVKSFAEWWN
jgi:hypothetical protein